MDHGDHLRALRGEVAGFAAVLADGDLDRPVAACPGWALRDLGQHLGAVHRWAASAVRHGKPTDPPAGPDEQGALHRWYVESAAELCDALEGAGPDRGCWTLAPPRTAAFWSRRQAQEALVHRWDAEASQGRDAPLDAALCADGIDEVVTMFHPRQVRLGRAQPLTEAVALSADGSGWVLGEGPPRGALSGRPDRLLLVLWGRIPPSSPGVAVEGDGEVVAHVLGAGLVP